MWRYVLVFRDRVRNIGLCRFTKTKAEVFCFAVGGNLVQCFHLSKKFRRNGYHRVTIFGNNTEEVTFSKIIYGFPHQSVTFFKIDFRLICVYSSNVFVYSSRKTYCTSLYTLILVYRYRLRLQNNNEFSAKILQLIPLDRRTFIFHRNSTYVDQRIDSTLSSGPKTKMPA